MFMAINVEYYIIITNTVSELRIVTFGVLFIGKNKTISLLCVQHKLQYFPEILLRSVLCKKVEIIKTTPYGAGFLLSLISFFISLCFLWLV
jgi:hypothetical protein